MDNPEKWSKQERIRYVRKMFDSITPSYDILNRLLSLGMDARWRKVAASLIPNNPTCVLDIATGTGDLALTIKKLYPKTRVIGLDFASNMLKIARKKTEKANVSKVQYILGDGLHIPCADNSMDAATSAFALRNMPERELAICEMNRAVRKGGSVIILDMTRPKVGLMGWLAELYIAKILPTIGGVVSGDRAAYRYLANSIENFLTVDQVKSLFETAGLINVHSISLCFGVVCIVEGKVS